MLDPDELAMRQEVERRLDRPFARVQEQLEELFGREWEDIEVSIATSAMKKDRPEADIICELITEKVEVRTPVATSVRRAVVRWIGKPWRERENPWDKYKDRVPPTKAPAEEWKPFRPDEDPR